MTAAAHEAGGSRAARRARLLAVALSGLLGSMLAGGTAAGAPGDTIATQVENINPAGASSNPDWLTNVNGTLLFAADDGSRGIELWKSDGTAAGTDIVEDIYSGALDSFPNNLIDVNGTLFFAASDPANGMELWKSVAPYDAASTSIVEDIRTGQCSCPFNFANVNGTLFFAASNGTNGEELWKSAPPDYDAGSTEMVEDINTTPSIDVSSNPSKLTNVNGTLLFAAIDGVTGNASDGFEGELWKSSPPDYDAGSTSLVEDIRMGATGSIPFEFAAVGGTLFLNANDGPADHGPELWKSAAPFDMTSTDLVEDIRMGTTGSFPGGLTNVNGILFFTADDGMNGMEPWKSTDGEPAGTDIVENIASGITGSAPGELADVNGTLFFSADDGGAGSELWKSTDGTPAGTDIVEDIRLGATGSDPSNLTNVNGTLFFTADAGSGAGVELWKSDGTAAGTKLVADLNPYASVSPGAPSPLADVNGILLLSADDGSTGVELWRTAIEAPGPPVLTPPAAIPTPPAAPKRKCKRKKGKKTAAAAKRKCKRKRRK